MTSSEDNLSQQILYRAMRAAIEKKGENNLAFHVASIGAFTDYFFITSGHNEKQVQAIADAISLVAKKEFQLTVRMEGYTEGRWILVDLGSVVVHVFHDYIREYYKLEELWAQAPRVAVPAELYQQ